MNAPHQPTSLTREQVRRADRLAIEEYGLPGIALMENAGRGAAELLLERAPQGRIVVCAGRGNNGGDGFVIARHLEAAGCDVRVLLFAEADRVAGDAAVNLAVLQKAATPLRVFGSEPDLHEVQRELRDAEWIVDAVLGTGTRGELRAPFPQLIQAINDASRRVLAVDLPSGLDCDTGDVLGACVRADLTATFVAAKPGFTRPQAVPFLGEVHVVPIGFPKTLLQNLTKTE
jgi:NAD(P)H-hydrate epimerase